jgi:LPS export ABC transporter protein LptC
LLGTVALSGCHRNTPGTPAPQPGKPKSSADVGILLKHVRLEMNDDQGRPLYRIKSPASQGSSATKSATLTDTTVTLYHEGQPDMIVIAPKTTVETESKTLVMTGGVTAKAPARKQTFHVDRLTWNADTKVYVGAGHVRYLRPPVEMTAARITGKTPVTTMQLEGGVRLNVRPNETGNP